MADLSAVSAAGLGRKLPTRLANAGEGAIAEDALLRKPMSSHLDLRDEQAEVTAQDRAEEAQLRRGRWQYAGYVIGPEEFLCSLTHSDDVRGDRGVA